MAVLALVRHPGSRAEFLLGLGLACLMALLFVMLGMLCRQAVGLGDKVAIAVTMARVRQLCRSASAVMITGILSLAGLG